MTAAEITKIIASNYRNNLYQLKNAYIFSSAGDRWECDFFCMSNSGYFYEFEVKISRSDFFNDFKKSKHLLFASMIDRKGCADYKIPHRFYYVVPEGLILPEEVPSYAGLSYIVEGVSVFNKLKPIKPAPFIHKNKFDINRILLNKHYFRAENLRFQLDDARRQIKELKSIINDRDNILPRAHLSEISE